MKHKESNLGLIKTRFGKDVFVEKGFQYVLRTGRIGKNGEKSWRCRYLEKFKCSATLKTLNGEIIGGNEVHTHGEKDHLIRTEKKNFQV